MKELFDSRFIIDGVAEELTPAQMLGRNRPPVDGEPIVDETVDPAILSFEFDEDKISSYLRLVKKARPELQFPLAAQYARARLAGVLIEAIWSHGHFTLPELSVDAKWSWHEQGIGSMSALYESVRAVSEYADILDIGFSSVACEDGGPEIEMKVPQAAGRAIPATLNPDPESWIVYVPFDTEEYRLGGSLLAQALGLKGGACPQVDSPDYLMDCYEVVRELVEDRIAISGISVGAGGLMYALDKMAYKGVGADLDLSDLKRAYPGSDVVRLLFGEVPGVIFQIRDDDFDYLDAEFILQDVMYFPLGHPKKEKGINIRWTSKPAIGSILESLVR